VINIRMMGPFPYPLAASEALADTSVLCISPKCLIVGGSLDPVRLDTSKESTLHMEDSSPAALSSIGTPNTVAAPIRSTWTMDCVAIRLRADVDFVLRSTSAIATVSSITW
jgi:hypothetical protein